MQESIDKILQRKPVVPTVKTNLPKIPSFSITDINVFLQFEKDLADEQFFNIIFQRIFKSCQYISKNSCTIALSVCLNVIISRDILTHFEWENFSNKSELFKLSKCINFLRLFHKIVTQPHLQNEQQYTRAKIESFFRVELKKDPKVPKCWDVNNIHKFPKLSTEQKCVIKSSLPRTHILNPNQVLVHKVRKRVIHVPVSTATTTFIGIDAADIQSEITSTEIDLNSVKYSDETQRSLDNVDDDDDDNEIQDSRINDDYEEPEIDADTTNFSFSDSAASIIELHNHNDNAECGFEIVNC
ncbi:unnamed protein product [Diamesa tonsa]